MSVTRRGVFSMVLALALVSLGRGGETADTLATDRAAIDNARGAFTAALRANDCHALLEVMSNDVVFVPPNAPNASGKEAVRARCEAAFRQARTSAATVSERGVTVAGDWAIEHGKFDWSLIPVAGGSPKHDQGNFVVIWHRQPNGSWQVTRDIWNSSQPVSDAR